MKKIIGSFLKVVTLMVLTIGAHSFLEARHHNLYNQLYDQCKEKLIAEDNYNTNEQAFQCVKDGSRELRILGTLLFNDGSYLEDL